MEANFGFEQSVKHPYIPCYINEKTTIYPLKGNCIFVGSEYIYFSKKTKVVNLIYDIFIIYRFNTQKNRFFDIIK